MIDYLNNEVKEVVESSASESVIENDNDEIDDDIGTYYFYIVQNGDTYHTISARYNIEENILKD